MRNSLRQRFMKLWTGRTEDERQRGNQPGQCLGAQVVPAYAEMQTPDADKPGRQADMEAGG
jgi:hypothetical protein